MLNKFMIVAAVIAVACFGYLILSPMEKDSFFLTNYLGQVIYPKLARDQRRKRLSFLAGTVLSTVLVGAALVFLIKYMSKVKMH